MVEVKYKPVFIHVNLPHNKAQRRWDNTDCALNRGRAVGVIPGCTPKLLLYAADYVAIRAEKPLKLCQQSASSKKHSTAE